jgi:hypothetical protein
VSILQCKIFSDFPYIAEQDFNDWCKANNIGPYDIKDIKYTINSRNSDHCIFVLYSKGSSSEVMIDTNLLRDIEYTGTPN